MLHSNGYFFLDNILGSSLTSFPLPYCPFPISLFYIISQLHTNTLVDVVGLYVYTMCVFRYDVWLHDWRLSRMHPLEQVESAYTLDDIAAYDHTAAVDKVLEVTNKVFNDFADETPSFLVYVLTNLFHIYLYIQLSIFACVTLYLFHFS